MFSSYYAKETKLHTENLKTFLNLNFGIHKAITPIATL